MKKLKIALVQMHSEKGEIDHNLKAIEVYVRESSMKGCEIICFPEMSLTGYINPVKHQSALLSLDSEPVGHILHLSKVFHILIVAGLAERRPDGKPFITQIAVQDGQIICVYRKKTIATDEREWFSPGDSLGIFIYQGIKIGLSICADIDNGCLFQEYANSGAQLILESAAPGLYGEQSSRNWQTGFTWWKDECYRKLGRYAKDNGIYIAVATQAGRTVDEDFPGGGYLFAPDGRCLRETTDWSEGILVGDLEHLD